MCGRYTMSDPHRSIGEFSILEKHPRLEVSPAALEPRYNIAPSQGVWVVRMPIAGKGPRLDLLRWGLVRARPSATGIVMVRAESLASRAPFAAAFRQRRCLFVADGFYEWRRAGKKSFPYHVRRPDQGLLTMAGIWQKAPPGETPAALDSCAIITRPAGAPVHTLHDRMPAMIAPEDHAAWLDPAFDDTTALERMLEADPAPLEIVPVGPRVNAPANDDPSCIRPVTEADHRGEQFEFWPKNP
jgi:putative SOS response-associated peptidase YedK